MNIRELQIDELKLLSKLHTYNDLEDMIVQNTKRINNKEIAIYALFENNEIIGELRVMYQHENPLFTIMNKRVYLYAFRIKSEHQGQGKGKYLLNSVIELLRAQNYTEFSVGVEDDNDKAIHMYKQAGFNKLIARIKEDYQGDEYEYNLFVKTCDHF